MGGILQSIDVEVNITGGNVDFPDVISVTECEVKRVFAGGGSEATVEVIFEDLLTQQEKNQIRSSVPGATPSRRYGDYKDIIYTGGFINEEDIFPAGVPQTLIDADELFSGEDIEITIDIAMTNQEPNNVEEYDERVFTGTVTKVTENNDRVVTFKALDKRYQMNQNLVKFDTGDEGVTTTEIIRNILDKSNSSTGLQLTEGEDYTIDLDGDDPITIVNETWGVNQNESVYNVLQNLAYKEGATVHIDEYNVIHFVKYPNHNKYTPETIPPILEWESGDKKTESDVIVESKYDESGLGIYSPMSSIPNRDEPDLPGNVGKEITSDNVFSRSAIEKNHVSEVIDREIMRDSGTLKCAGDPRLEAYDTVVLNENAVDGFSAISTGEYMAKEVRHIISGSDGYIIELDLGDSPREILEEFAKESGNVEFRKMMDAVNESESEDKSIWSPLALGGAIAVKGAGILKSIFN